MYMEKACGLTGVRAAGRQARQRVACRAPAGCHAPATGGHTTLLLLSHFETHQGTEISVIWRRDRWMSCVESRDTP